jgi:deoxyribodipyrimidine photo-lyase
MNTLYWFTDDLRAQDNPALMAASQDANLTMIFCIDEQWFRTDRFGNRQLGKHRWQFLQESLLDLHHGLTTLGQALNILSGSPQSILSNLLASGRFTRVVRTRQHTIHEKLIWQQLLKAFPDILFGEYDSATLFQQDSVQFGTTFPPTFS